MEEKDKLRYALEDAIQKCDKAEAFIKEVISLPEDIPSPPSLSLAERLLDSVRAFLFPQTCAEKAGRREAGIMLSRLLCESLSCLYSSEDVYRLVDRIFSFFPQLLEMLSADACAIYESDPAATSAFEVVLSYPGFFAITAYRFSHILYREGIPLLPRMISEISHRKTGIDIHPGAEIGRAFSIDHGTGIVIGETAVIGERVKIFQGVTIGARSIKTSNNDKDRAHPEGQSQGCTNPQKEKEKEVQAARIIKKRHPTIESDCTICTGAVILGGDTVIGKGSVIGAGAVVTHSVPQGQIVRH